MGADLKSGYLRKPAGTVRRFCQTIRLNPETIDLYRHWHERGNIWPEIPEGIRRAGVLDMEIYLSGTTAVMVLETPAGFDWDESFGRLAAYERQAEWEDFVSSFQEAAPGMKSDEKWRLCERIFSLEEALDNKK